MLYTVSILALVALFAIGTMTPINMGVLAFAAAFLVGGWLSGIPLEDIFVYFPGSIFTIIVGITLLFGIARVNGTVDLLVNGALKLVRGRRWAIVWLMFFLGAGLMTMGSVLAVGMLAPIAMPIAKRYKIDPLLMGMMISHGVLGAAFSPITVYGAFTNGWLQSEGLPTNPLALYSDSTGPELPARRRALLRPRSRSASYRWPGDRYRRRHRPADHCRSVPLPSPGVANW